MFQLKWQLTTPWFSGAMASSRAALRPKVTDVTENPIPEIQCLLGRAAVAVPDAHQHECMGRSRSFKHAHGERE